MATASAPSPIYPIYQQRWHFSVTILTAIFAAYVIGLFIALLFVGSLSDHVGRRPVLIAAFTTAALSTVLFWTAYGPISLIIARVVQGLASGTAMSPLAAGLLDLTPRSGRNRGATLTAVGTSIGMAVGAGGVGLLLQWTTEPDSYVFPLLTLVFLVLAATSCFLPQEPVNRKLTLAAFRPSIRVDTDSLQEFWGSFPSTVAGWASTGLFLALMPSLAGDLLGLGSSAGGLTIAALYVAVTVGNLAAGRCRIRTARILGASLLTSGAVAVAFGLAATSIPLFMASSLATGMGVGLTFNGNLRALGAVTAPGRRSETFAAVYVLSYMALSIPVLAAGMAAPSWGLRYTSYAFLAALGLLSLAALVCAVPWPRGARHADLASPRQQITG